MKTKVLILLPDGVGLRNFVFSDFPKIAKKQGLELKYWNATNFDLGRLGLESNKLTGKAHYKTDLMKRARKEIEIRLFSKKFNNKIFYSYLFKTKSSGLKSSLKNYLLKNLIEKYQNNLTALREEIKIQERKTSYYTSCLRQLEQEKPVMVFCTNQRPVQAVGPILAAQSLGIPTATFIFSWDNLPKATMVLETDYYFVWSDYMAQQLVEYYPYIKPSQIKVTGSPQFELHFKTNYLEVKSEFCKQNGLPEDKKFICFSGDDVTTSPHDPQYLNDVCEAVKGLNSKGFNCAVIFRPCPVDFSNRYEDVLVKFKNLVYCLRPKWKPQGEAWNSILPTQADQVLLYNTIAHSELVINLGSSMVFDAACHKKACAYINYNPNLSPVKKDVRQIYKYIHFQSMPSNRAVVWLNSKEEISKKIVEAMENSEPHIQDAKNWLRTICRTPQEASKNIVNAIKECIDL